MLTLTHLQLHDLSLQQTQIQELILEVICKIVHQNRIHFLEHDFGMKLQVELAQVEMQSYLLS